MAVHCGPSGLAGKWKYDAHENMLRITIRQTQDFLFQFPLQLAVKTGNNTVFKTVEIRNRNTGITIPLKDKPVALFLDPNINLLFEGNIEEEK